MSEISLWGFEFECLLTYYQNTWNFLPHLRGKEIALVNTCIKENKKAAASKRQIKPRKKLEDEDNMLFQMNLARFVYHSFLFIENWVPS